MAMMIMLGNCFVLVALDSFDKTIMSNVSSGYEKWGYGTLQLKKWGTSTHRTPKLKSIGLREDAGSHTDA